MAGERAYKPVVLVTGCSTGIGLALTRLLWNRPDFRVVVTARAESLKRLHGEIFKDNDRFWFHALDVTSELEREKLFQAVGERWGGVDILVNNAGVSYRGTIEHMDEASEQKQMATNYFGPMGMIRLALPYMRLRGRGKIISVSSVSGMLAMPTMGSYSASKYALEGACESLWYEMRPLGINVTLIQPGFIHSNSFRNVLRPPKAQACDIHGEAPYCDYYRNMEPFVEKMMDRSFSTPEKIASRILWVITHEKPPLRVAATLDAAVFHFLRRFLPRQPFHALLFYLLPGAQRWGRGYTHARK